MNVVTTIFADMDRLAYDHWLVSHESLVITLSSEEFHAALKHQKESSRMSLYFSAPDTAPIDWIKDANDDNITKAWFSVIESAQENYRDDDANKDYRYLVNTVLLSSANPEKGVWFIGIRCKHPHTGNYITVKLKLFG
jgi:hypothetical protein